jgi:ribonuclease T
MSDAEPQIKDRFRGFLPVVVDLETGGFNAHTDALLEIAVTLIRMTPEGVLVPGESMSFNVDPFEGANLEPAALEFTGIDPDSSERDAVPEEYALNEIFSFIRREIREQHCNRAILVAHNAHFDAGFLTAASNRSDIKRNPFHPFSFFDTATLSGLAYGQTVLAKACRAASIPFDNAEAHCAAYDAAKTAELFCGIVNAWRNAGCWPPSQQELDD